MRKFYMILIALVGLLALGCSLDSPQVVEVEYHQPQGEEIFSNYVAIGNSLTAGFMDGGLVMAGQVNSFPQLIATSFGYPAGSFYQPLIGSPGVGSSDVSHLGEDLVAGVLHFNAAAGRMVPLDVYSRDDVPGMLLAAAVPVPYSNLGVPGATTLDITNALGAATSQAGDNSFFDFILRNPTFGNVSMLNQLIARGPTIMTMWVGNNDILGGSLDGQPNDGVVHADQDVNITPAALFGQMYNTLLDGVLDGVENRHGHRPLIFVGNIPSITSIPHFMSTDLFRQVAGLPDEATMPVFSVEADAVLVLLPALSYDGSSGPLIPAEYTLSQAEADLVAATVVAYNDIISDAVAARPEVFLYDANAVMAGYAGTPQGMHFLVLAASLGYEAAEATTLFSLDGIHPNNKGYGVVANGFLAVMNTELGTDFPMVDTGALTWDPTYGVGYGKALPTRPSISPEAATAMRALFR